MTSIQIDVKDGLSSATAIKGPVRVATTGNITLSGEQTIDGVSIVTDDRVLVKSQTTGSENGIWICDTGAWRRSKDFNKTRDVKKGTLVLATSGTQAGVWQVVTTDPITVGSSNIAFVQTVQPYDADLASWSAVTRAAGFDDFAATPSSANLAALLTDETGTGANVFANTPTLVTPNIGAATGLSLNVQTSGTGAYSATGRYQFNSMVIAADDKDMGLDGGKVDGLTINHQFGGSAARGGRHAVESFATLTAATAADNPDRNYTGGAFTGWALSDDGGGVGTERGGIFGFNAQGVLANGATNFLNVSGGEVNVAINTGASVKYKSGLQICSRPDDAVKGSTYDTLLALSGQVSAVKHDYGILIGPMNGAHPVDTTGTIIGTSGAATVTNGIDFSSYTISGTLLKGPGVSISGNGVSNSFTATNASFELGNPNAVNTPFIDFHSSGNVVDYDVRLLASGGSAVAGTGTLTITGGVSISAFVQALQVLATGTGGVGYTTGAGGTVTQATSRTTGVTLNKTCGAITMFSAAGSATAATFTVTNSTVAATDTIVLSQKSGTNLYNLHVTAVAAGSFNITFYTTGGTATDAPVINFAVVKAVTT